MDELEGAGFAAIISGHLGRLQRELVEQCELQALQRERRLRHTIDQLKLELDSFRAGVSATQAEGNDPPSNLLDTPLERKASDVELPPASLVAGQRKADVAPASEDSAPKVDSSQEEVTARISIRSAQSVAAQSAAAQSSGLLSPNPRKGVHIDSTMALVERPQSFIAGIWDEWLEDAPGESFYLSAENHFKSIEARMRRLSAYAELAPRKSRSSLTPSEIPPTTKADHSTCWAKIRSHIGIVSPASYLRLFWDMFGIPVLLYDLVTIPLGVYEIPPNVFTELSFWIILTYWTIDILMTFCTGYFNRTGQLVMDPLSIAWHYVTGSFWLDMVIVLGDWIPILLSALGIGTGSGASTLRILRIFRTARFMRLLRLRRLKEIGAEMEDYLDSAYTTVCIGIAVKILGIIAINHFLGCAWFGVGSLEFTGYRSWVEAHNYDHTHWTYQYLTSLHWAITQFTPGGTNIQCHNPTERIFAVGTLLFALVVFSSFVSSLTQARLELQALTSKYQKESWMLRRYLRQRRVSRELSMRICAYVNAKVIANADILDGKGIVLLEKLSQPLLLDLQVEVFGRHVMNHAFFRRLDEVSYRTMTEVCNRVLSSESLALGDLMFLEGCMCQAMYFVIEGRMLYFFNSDEQCVLKLTSGGWCCEAVLWTKWVHVGSMGCEEVSTLVRVDNDAFRQVIIADPVAWGFAKHYAFRFIDLIKGQEQHIGPRGLHDLHAHVVVDTAHQEVEFDR